MHCLPGQAPTDHPLSTLNSGTARYPGPVFWMAQSQELHLHNQKNLLLAREFQMSRQTSCAKLDNRDRFEKRLRSEMASLRRWGRTRVGPETYAKGGAALAAPPLAGLISTPGLQSSSFSLPSVCLSSLVVSHNLHEHSLCSCRDFTLHFTEFTQL